MKNDAFTQTKQRTWNQTARRNVKSSYRYPEEYHIKAISEQIKICSKIFGLNEIPALEFAKILPALPNGAEGWFAVPKISAIAQKNFPTITDHEELYCEVLKILFEKIAIRRSFYNYYMGQITPAHIHQHPRTIKFLSQLESEQKGDILILAAQYGLKYRGKTVNMARKRLLENEFGLGTFHTGCMLLIHPDRQIRYSELDIDCLGDEFSPMADGNFSEVPNLFIDDGKLKFDARSVSSIRECYGSVSAFVSKRNDH